MTYRYIQKVDYFERMSISSNERAANDVTECICPLMITFIRSDDLSDECTDD